MRAALLCAAAELGVGAPGGQPAGDVAFATGPVRCAHGRLRGSLRIVPDSPELPQPPLESVIDHVIESNRQYAQTFPGPRPTPPALHLAVVTCMDSRLDLFGALGLQIGDAHLIRNAGGVVTDDVLRSLAISQRLLGTREIAVIHHTECGMFNFDDVEFRYRLTKESGIEPQWRVPGFTDLELDVRISVDRIKQSLWLEHRNSVRGFIFDVASAEITEISHTSPIQD
ncbi:MAG: carbonic anhydrase [Pseudonocardiales bacterium]|nr:carbonic anhydrase [Pseudonocardiales bacterium]